jgi:hypothetical protein
MVSWPTRGVNRVLLRESKALAEALIVASHFTASDGRAHCFLEHLSPPPFLHYCRSYHAQNATLGKRAVPHDVLACDREHFSPHHLRAKDRRERVANPENQALTDAWNAISLCTITQAINLARTVRCGTASGTSPAKH